MASTFEYAVTIEIDRVEGKFASRDELEQAVIDALDSLESSIDLSGLGADGDSEYEVIGYNYEEITAKKGTK